MIDPSVILLRTKTRKSKNIDPNTRWWEYEKRLQMRIRHIKVSSGGQVPGTVYCLTVATLRSESLNATLWCHGRSWKQTTIDWFHQTPAMLIPDSPEDQQRNPLLCVVNWIANSSYLLWMIWFRWQHRICIACEVYRRFEYDQRHQLVR